MNNLIKLQVLAVLLASCVTQKQKDKICATCQHADSVRIVKKDTIIYRDTAVYLSMHGDTVTIPCPEIVKPIDIVKIHNGIRTEVKSVGKSVECICSDDSLKLIISKIRADHYAEIDNERNEKYLIQCDKRHHTGWDSFGNWCAWILIGSFIVSLGFFALHLYEKFK